MAGREKATLPIVDDDRAHTRTAVEVDRHDRELAFARKRDQPVANPQAVDDEAVHHRRLDPPGSVLSPPGRDQRHTCASFVADLGDAGHEHAGEGIAEEVGSVVGHDDSDGVDLASAEQPALGIGAGVAQAPGRGLDPLPDLRPDEVRPIEHIRGGPLGNPGGLRHVCELDDPPLHRLDHTDVFETFQRWA